MPRALLGLGLVVFAALLLIAALSQPWMGGTTVLPDDRTEALSELRPSNRTEVETPTGQTQRLDAQEVQSVSDSQRASGSVEVSSRSEADRLIAGSVFEEETSFPVPGVTVYLESRRDGRLAETTTNGSGSFSFSSDWRAGLHVVAEPRNGWYYPLSKSVPVKLRDWKEQVAVRIPVETRGSIRGFVRDAWSGAGIRGARIEAAGSWVRTVSSDRGSHQVITSGQVAETHSDERGQYRLEGVPGGTWTVSVGAESYLEGTAPSVEVVPLRETDGIDFLLGKAPVLSGRVLDEAGDPVVRAVVLAKAEGDIRPASGLSSEDGTFTVLPLKDEQQGLIVEKDGYRPFGTWEHPGSFHAPGEQDIVVRLESARTTVFIVVDADTLMPVERFGLEIEVGYGREGEKTLAKGAAPFFGGRPPEPEQHPDGVIERYADPGLDLYRVHAVGYPGQEGEVLHDDPLSGRQTIRLRHFRSPRDDRED